MMLMGMLRYRDGVLASEGGDTPGFESSQPPFG